MGQRYALDSSAVIHLASLRKDYSNTFRLSVTLTEEIRPEILKEAAGAILPRVPFLAAGIQKGFFQYYIQPAAQIPTPQADTAILAPMSQQELASCGLRVLYSRHRLSIELFHSLTDGYGGKLLLQALAEEYLRLAHGLPRPAPFFPLSGPACAKYEQDEYPLYAKKGSYAVNCRTSYRLPGSPAEDGLIRATTAVYQLQGLKQAAHSFGVSLSAFLAAVLAETVADIQKKHIKKQAALQPIQIMVPVNLRQRFPSETLRNFSLYALVCAMPQDQKLSFPALARLIAGELSVQTSREYLAAMMESNVSLQNSPAFRFLPLPLKRQLLKAAFHLCGERNSSLSLSNLGEFTFSEDAAPFVSRADFLLSPRRNAPYNCGIASFGGSLSITFTRKSSAPELEPLFFEKLGRLGCPRRKAN